MLTDCLTHAGLLNAETIAGLGTGALGAGTALLRAAEAGARSTRCSAGSRA